MIFRSDGKKPNRILQVGMEKGHVCKESGMQQSGGEVEVGILAK